MNWLNPGAIMMSTPLSTRLPNSPQVTASVVKFRCLYTHDLRRKSKRWHDGNLRYHKFNKRVMVYDDQGNFIGDHHWRSNDEVQDGDEMELDKGVLIEVGENIGTTETDISNLYEKKKGSQGSPQAKDPDPQVLRPSVAASASISAPIRCASSSQPFRSLNDLLGIRKTPVSRFASPYEQRNAQAPVRVETEPAPKRQKTSCVNSTAEKDPRTQSQVIDLTEEANGAGSRPAPNPLAREAIRSDIDLPVPAPTTHQQRPTLATPTRGPRIDPHPFSEASIPASSGPDFSLPTPESLIRPATKAVPPTRPRDGVKDTPPVQPHRPSEPLPNTFSAAQLETAKLPRPISNTRVDKQPARETQPTRAQPLNPTKPQRAVPPVPKRPLLTTSNYPIVQPLVEKSVAAEPSRPLRVNEPPVSRENQAQAALPLPSFSPPVQPQKRVPPVSETPLSNTSKGPTIRPTVEQSAPAVSNNVQPAKSRDNHYASNTMPPPSRPLTTKPSETPTAALRMSAAKPRRKLMYSALLPGASRTPSPTTSNTPPNSASRRAATTPLGKENAAERLAPPASTSSEDFMPSTSTQFIFDEMLDGSGFKPSALGGLGGRRSIDSSLRKSISDPTALRNTNDVGVTRPSEQGAWTSDALDLFDFWPAGRPKPTE